MMTQLGKYRISDTVHLCASRTTLSMVCAEFTGCERSYMILWPSASFNAKTNERISVKFGIESLHRNALSQLTLHEAKFKTVLFIKMDK
jgi:hypothetical protein